MINYSGDLALDVTVRGPLLVINELHSLTVNAIDIPHDSNFHQVLESNVVISSLNSSLNGNIPNDQMLRYKRLPHPTFTDTMFAGTTSKRGNKCAQIYATSF